ncbi:hypothetical protein L1F34_000267 [Mammaliicoccus lentus]|uniref:MptD family putative ECF transporter S component n=1 Tax=Mammaliicoccus lentus TaxID=42858 RepID=UPI0039E8213B
MIKESINIKDLINIGVFTAVYIVLYFLVGMTGFIPIFMVILPGLIGLVGAIPIFLLITKVEKYGALTILSIILSILFAITGDPWFGAIIMIFFGILADLIMKIGKYKKWPYLLIGYIVFSFWPLGGLSPFYFARESYLNSLKDGYGNEYVQAIDRIFTFQAVPIIIIFGIIGSIIGAYVAKSAMSKHFKQSGVI